MSKTKKDQNRLQKFERDFKRQSKVKSTYITEKFEKRTRNALRSNNISDIVNYSDY